MLATVNVSFSGDADSVRRAMKHFLGETCNSAASCVESTKTPDVTPAPAVEQASPKKTRGRPSKQTQVEEVKTVAPEETAGDEQMPSDGDGIVYRDVEDEAKAEPTATVVDLRTACVAAADSVSVERVQKLLMEKYKTTVAAEVPPEKIAEAIKLVKALKPTESF